MSSLLNKRAQFEKKVLENWSHAQELVEDKLWQNLKVFFEVKGIRPHIVDFMSYVEKWTPQASREALSYFLDFFRPATLGMGLRVSKLNDTQIEVVLPKRPKNLDEDGQWLDSAMITASVESVKILWLRHAPIGDFQFQIDKLSYEKRKDDQSDNVRVRYELSAETRESALADLRSQSLSNVETQLFIFDDKESIVAEVKIWARMKSALQLKEKN
ncbi:MAG: hypothetical protein JNL11_04810 [Bdellovibrionaceae bacterium]|nr:hypothetical protein [Pseudobdellovibrionaceae bacterium]